MSRRVPVLTLLMVGGALVAALVPSWAPRLAYDRPAILSGQWWLLLTGHWVHFSTAHLVWDVIPFGIAAWILEERRIPQFGWFCLLTPAFISTMGLVFEPRMRICAGLSGLGCAMFTLLALRGLSEGGLWRWVCAAVLAGIAGKILFELGTGRCLFVRNGGEPVIVAVSNHIGGVVAALVFYRACNHEPPRMPRRRDPAGALSDESDSSDGSDSSSGKQRCVGTEVRRRARAYEDFHPDRNRRGFGLDFSRRSGNI